MNKNHKDVWIEIEQSLHQYMRELTKIYNDPAYEPTRSEGNCDKNQEICPDKQT